MIIYSSSVVEKLIVVYNGIIAKVKESAKSILKPPQFAFGYRNCCSLGALAPCVAVQPASYPLGQTLHYTRPFLRLFFLCPLGYIILLHIVGSFLRSCLSFALVFVFQLSGVFVPFRKPSAPSRLLIFDFSSFLLPSPIQPSYPQPSSWLISKTTTAVTLVSIFISARRLHLLTSRFFFSLDEPRYDRDRSASPRDEPRADRARSRSPNGRAEDR